ncbi:FKBP12-associated protein [Mortierella sp. 14UC]|nr:FKBP12-associated protein [Mortierella sp. 14UC]
MTVTTSGSSSTFNSTLTPLLHSLSALSNPAKAAHTAIVLDNDDAQQATLVHHNHSQRNNNQRRSHSHATPSKDQRSSGRSRLNPSAKDYVPSTSTSTSSSLTSTQSRRSGKAVSGGRIDDDHSQETSDPRQLSTNNHSRSGKQQNRRGGNRHAENSSNSGHVSNSPATNKHSVPRSQRKELNGRTFPTAQSIQSSTVTAHQEHNHGDESATPHTHNAKNDRHRYNRTATARSRVPAPFVHRVEEDRGLLEALTAGLTNSTYDCMVCWDVIRPAHKIWNCQVCWAAFHLDCLSTWAKKSSEETSTQSSGWRCPGCQNTQVSLPSEYQCFCGKVSNPDYNRYFTPHSCGELCGRKRECPHPCNIPCHPGPCPPCGGLGPVQYCHCGNESFQLRCVDTDFTFQTGKSCNQVCGELLGCGKHSCSSVCHSGLCAPCEEEQEQMCYCGKHSHTARCGEGKPKTTVVDGQIRTGFYDCREACDRLLDCGYHTCSKTCHPHDQEQGPCSATPNLVRTCPCGSKSIDTLLMGKSRTSCQDPIPVCGSTCNKFLNCGHSCQQKCHLGPCAPCKVTVSVDCRCGSTHVDRICSEMGLHSANGEGLPTCSKPCRGLRSCGKHRCTNRCCPAKPQAKGALKLDPVSQEAHASVAVQSCTLQLLAELPSPSADTPVLVSGPVDMTLMRPIPVTQTANHAHLASSLSPNPVCAANPRCPTSRATSPNHPAARFVASGWTALVVSSCKCGYLTKETTCQATVENPWDARARVIKCNDYCLVAERNKRVALALDIDPTPPSGPRIPVYSEPILEYAAQNMEFTLKTERKIADWIADPTLRTLHLPPMKGPHRKFIHELVAHYNLASESVDMEPYRSVILRKTPNTSVPDLLASQATRQRRPRSSLSGGLEQLRKQPASTVKNPVNAIYLHDLVFGLTRGELSNRLAPIFGSVKYSLRWLTDDDAVLVVQAGPSQSMEDVETTLVRLCSLIKTHTAANPLCERVDLCWVNKEGEVVSHNNNSTANKRFFNSATGSQLLKKPDPPKVKNAFSALLVESDRERVENDRSLKVEAWDEGVSFSSSSSLSLSGSGAFKSSSRPSSAEGVRNDSSLPSSSSSPLISFSSARGAITTKGVVDADDNVVDDWQQLLDDD